MKKINKKTSILLIVVAIIFIAILTLLLWLQQGQFRGKNAYKGMPYFIEYYKDDLVYENDGILIPVDLEGQAFVAKSAVYSGLQSGTAIKSIWNEDGRLKVNFKRMGIRVPLSFAYKYSVENGELFLELSDMKITKNETALSPSIENFIKNFIGLKDEKLKLSNPKCILSEGFEILSVENKKDVLNMKVAYDDEFYKKMMSYLHSDFALATYYKENNENILSQAIQPKNDEITYDKMKFLELIIAKPELMYDLLSLQEDYDVELINMIREIYYPLNIDKEMLGKNREKLVAVYVDTYVKVVFSAFAEHFKENKFAPSQGRPYDLSEYKVYTVKDLLASEGKDASVPVYSSLRFVFDGSSFRCAYRIGEDKYYVRSVKDREFLSEKDFKQKYAKGYSLSPVLSPAKVSEEKRTEFVEYFKTKLKSDEVFVRYLRSVGDYYILLLSDKKEYEDYRIIAIKNEGEKIKDEDVLSNSINDIRKFLRDYDDFPAQLFPPELRTTKLIKLSSDTLIAIMDEMSIRGLASGGAERIKYASYDGSDYIYFVLDDDSHFVFKVEQTAFGTYLATVYPKEKAFKNWDDINVLITLE